MILIACVDDKGGILFNHRRQSQDRILRDRVKAMTAASTLYMSPYTARQFGGDLPENAVVSDNFLDEAGDGDYCFVEDADPAPYEDRAEKIVLYRWNRDYPRDTLFPIDMDMWNRESSQEFEGSSHDDITEEVYVR